MVPAVPEWREASNGMHAGARATAGGNTDHSLTWQHTAVASGLGSGCPSLQSSGAAPAMLLGQACAALSKASASRTSAYTAKLLYFEASSRLSVTSAACWTHVRGPRLNPEPCPAGCDGMPVLVLLPVLVWGALGNEDCCLRLLLLLLRVDLRDCGCRVCPADCEGSAWLLLCWSELVGRLPIRLLLSLLCTAGSKPPALHHERIHGTVMSPAHCTENCTELSCGQTMPCLMLNMNGHFTIMAAACLYS